MDRSVPPDSFQALVRSANFFRMASFFPVPSTIKRRPRFPGPTLTAAHATGPPDSSMTSWRENPRKSNPNSFFQRFFTSSIKGFSKGSLRTWPNWVLSKSRRVFSSSWQMTTSLVVSGRSCSGAMPARALPQTLQPAAISKTTNFMDHFIRPPFTSCLGCFCVSCPVLPGLFFG